MKGEAGLPATSILDPATVLAINFTAWTKLRSGALAQTALYMALTVDAKVRATNGTSSGGRGVRTGGGRHDSCLYFLPRVNPDPSSLSAKEWAELLG